jgi:adenylosuccinate synthase
MYIDLDVLMEEIKTCNVSPQRLCIDRNASVITGDDARQEVKAQLQQRLGSTLSGTGAATARKVLRCANVTLAASVPELHLFVGDVSAKLNEAIDRGDTVIVEGTQGFGLSLHHSDHFPFVTSRDTTAAAFLSDVGISPLLVTDIVLVLRTYPIRVSGFSGPMYKEISWEEVSQRSGSPARLAEYTTVTGKLRRVGEFDWELARRAVRVNRPTALAIHAIDYLDHNDFGKRSWEDLTQAGRGFVLGLEETLGVRVRYVFTGPEADYIIDRG